ncbi:transposable element Tcb2 transposase [Trichonephila clavipes]|nr:transposable element Tcb2 transposase [Trichonephila clavipes]
MNGAMFFFLTSPVFLFIRIIGVFSSGGTVDWLIDGILTSHCSATQGLLATDHVILNHGQVTWTTPELAPPSPNYHTTPREDVSALDRFNVHRCPRRRVFSGTGLEPVTKQATFRYLYHSSTTATWRDRGSRINPAFVLESVRFGGCGVLAYGGISIDGPTDLYIIRDGPLTARRYRDEILRPIVVPYAAAIGDDFILMDDNCRPHRANLVEDFLFEEGIVRMESVFSRHESNRERLGRSRKSSF